MNQFKLLLNSFPRKRLLVFGIILAILATLLTLFFSYFIKLMVDASTNKDFDLFYKLLYLVIALVAFEMTIVFLKTKILGLYTEGGINQLRNQLAKKITLMDYDTLKKSHSGETTSIATNDLAKVKNFTLQTLPELIRIPLTAIGALVFLLILSWKLTLISLAVIPILIFGANLLTKPIGPISKKLQEKLAKINTFSIDLIKGNEVSKAYNLGQVLESNYQNQVDESIRQGRELAEKRAILETFSDVLSIVPFIVTFLLGGYFVVVKNEMTIGSLLAFINLLNHLTFPISRLPMLITDAITDLVSYNRINSYLDEKEERKDGMTHQLIDTNPLIEFKNVSFSYPNEEETIINNLSLKINKNESVAFVGPSGGGKTTITKLIQGYYDNYLGEIYIGGHELKSWNLGHLREFLSLVSQDSFLFPESIEENISYGRMNATSDEIYKSAKLANAYNFITHLKDGFKTKVGELGNTLSGGQKQRITISRAILKNAPILLLDEPTSALDNESEKLVQDALDHFLINKTSLIVAHRLSTIKNVDKIFVLKEGSLVEEGTHDELIKRDGLYKELYKNQVNEVNVNEK